jgi:hypothetical protein
MLRSMKGWGQGGSSERSHDTLVLTPHPSPRLTIFGLEIVEKLGRTVTGSAVTLYAVLH